MVGISHAVIGASTAIAVSSVLGANTHSYILSIGIGTAASLLPDIDAEVSTIKIFAKKRLQGRLANSFVRKSRRNRFPDIFIHIGISLFEVIVGMTLLIVSTIFGKHRGLAHSLIFLALLSPISVISSALLSSKTVFGYVFIFGYLSHILTDSMTVTGVQMLAPFSKNHYHILPRKYRFTTGSATEVIYVGIFVLLAAICIVL